MNGVILRDRARALIERLGDGSRDDEARDSLIADLAAFQSDEVRPYERLTRARGGTWAMASWPPALPTDVFRLARVAVHDESEDVRVFRTSGTTSGARGAHPFRDLSLYDLAAERCARHMLFPDRERMRLVVLAPTEDDAPDSSLSYMLARFGEWFGTDTTHIWPLDVAALSDALDTQEPVALLGTSFAFVHLEDSLERRFELAPGGRVMQTGGFKGRSRTLDPQEMRTAITERFGIPETHVVAEYGMTELSSQFYETTLRDAWRGEASPRRLWTPGWTRVTPVDSQTLEACDGAGILRIDDTANVDSVVCLQTSDRGIRATPDGFQLLGRSEDAVPRGCSLAVEEALG